jgi:hypothetical protein
MLLLLSQQLHVSILTITTAVHSMHCVVSLLAPMHTNNAHTKTTATLALHLLDFHNISRLLVLLAPILINNATDATFVPPLLARYNRTQQLVRHFAQRMHQSS